jgi:hypothetical protein
MSRGLFRNTSRTFASVTSLRPTKYFPTDHRVGHCEVAIDRQGALALGDAVDRAIAILSRARKPRIADDIGDQDRGEFPGLAHGASAEARSPVARGLGMVRFHAALKRTWKQGAQPCVSARETYSRRGST